MQNTQSNDSTGATQESPEWIHVTSNRSSSAPPPVVKQERRSRTPESDAQRIACNATPTSPAYSGSPKRGVAHASMNWTDCTEDGCQIHLRNKQRSGWYPQFTRRSRKQVSPTTTTGDRRWKRTQERTGPHNNNLIGERLEGPMETSRGGSIVLMTNARITGGKRWTPDITPGKWERKGNCRRTTEGSRGREKP